ncbi:hypothetical protein OUZ56_001932 [Daphnia magna]|uniref:Uncharacterized protein n=1 Tax=Daphnia magna TaxID=35525 RepID=A0ABR0A465_9CRUS|nr:hypothetical protein OUZ56_001932 [Daphnia magna]
MKEREWWDDEGRRRGDIQVEENIFQKRQNQRLSKQQWELNKVLWKESRSGRRMRGCNIIGVQDGL